MVTTHRQHETGEFPLSNPKQTRRVVVLGLGGGGSAIAAQVAQLETGQQLTVAAADTDRAALEKLHGLIQVPLGQGWNCEDGCGSDVLLGERAAAAAVDDLRELIKDAKLLVVVAGLGGGAGGGAAKVVARLAHEQSLPVFFVLTFPFAFEGSWLRHQAEETLPPIRENSDAVMVVQNDLLFTTLSADTPVAKAFNVLDGILARTVAGIAAIAWAEWTIKVDFATIGRILRDHPESCSVGIGSGSGEHRWTEAVAAFVDCPLIGGADILRSASAAVVTVASGHDLSVAELRECLTNIQQYFPEQARVLVGACANDIREGDVQITGIICRSTEKERTAKRSDDQLEPQETDIPQHEDTNKKQSRKSKKSTTAQAVQAELPFQIQIPGIFSGVPPTRYHGENLDIPTFQRRGIHIDTDD